MYLFCLFIPYSPLLSYVQPAHSFQSSFRFHPHRSHLFSFISTLMFVRVLVLACIASFPAFTQWSWGFARFSFLLSSFPASSRCCSPSPTLRSPSVVTRSATAEFPICSPLCSLYLILTPPRDRSRPIHPLRLACRRCRSVAHPPSRMFPCI